MKKTLSALLCLLLMVSMFCMSVSAADYDIPTAPADAIIDKNGVKTWYMDGIKYTELAPIYENSIVNLPSTIEAGENIYAQDENTSTPYGAVTSPITIPYYCVLDDMDGNPMARFTVTISGLIYGTSRAEIESVTCKFTYTATSNYRSTITKQGNVATVRILLDGACIARYIFTLNVNGSITVT